MRSAGLVLVALVGCHFHRDVNAPGVIDPMVPPKDVTSQQAEYPDDPGEHRVMLTTGLLAGGGGSTAIHAGFFDLAPEVTLSYGQAKFTHNDHSQDLFIPRSAVVPPESFGVTVGWSALRFTKDKMTGDIEAGTGPVYVEAQRALALLGLGAGWAYDPETGATGPQAHAFFTFFWMRTRYLFGDDGGFEIAGGLQLKIPTTWTWRR